MVGKAPDKPATAPKTPPENPINTSPMLLFFAILEKLGLNTKNIPKSKSKTPTKTFNS